MNTPHPSGRLLPAARLGYNSRSSLLNPAPSGVEGRTDQGVDWSNITGNIGAVASGVITKIYQNLQGFGTTTIEQLPSGQEIYYAGETGAGAPVVQEGQQVQAGQEIAPGLGSGGIEVGYWDPNTGTAVGYTQGYTEGVATPAGASFRASLAPTPNSPRSSVGQVPTWVPPHYRDWVASAAQATGLPAPLVAAQIRTESGFNPNATSPAGAQGIAQFEPATWKQYGTGSPFNPANAERAYVNYMNTLLGQYNGSIRNALAAYNAGSGDIQAGYGYADSIMGAANVSQTATDQGPYTLTRPGGEVPGSTGSGVAPSFANYLALRDMPRTAPPGTANPWQWFAASFTGNWQNLGVPNEH